MSDECEKIPRLEDERWAAHRREHELMDEMREAAKEYMKEKMTEMNQVRAQINEERGWYLKVVDFSREYKTLEDRLDLKTEGLAKQIQQVQKFAWMAAGAASIIVVLVELVLGHR